MNKNLKNWNSEVDKASTGQPLNIQDLRLILCEIKDAYYISKRKVSEYIKHCSDFEHNSNFAPKIMKMLGSTLLHILPSKLTENRQ